MEALICKLRRRDEREAGANDADWLGGLAGIQEELVVTARLLGVDYKKNAVSFEFVMLLE